MWIAVLSDFFSRRQSEVSLGVCWLLTGFLYTVAFPPFNAPEAAFVFLVPFFLWLRREPSMKVVGITSVIAFWVAWIVLIFWLRHVSFVGMLMLSCFVSAHFTLFAMGALWLSKRMLKRGPWMGVLFSIAVAALWVVVEHVRFWLLTGFPWLPLSASQWDRPIMLQSAAFLGSWGISFVLIVLNAGLAAYSVRIFEYARSKKKTFCPEFYFALILFVSFTFLMTRQATGQLREPLMKAAVLQPVIPQNQKWDEAFATDILHRLYRNSVLLKPMEADVLFWPEAPLPYQLKGDPAMRSWAERLANDIDMPIVTGGFAVEKPLEEGGESIWRNSVLLVRPKWGVHPVYYSKRHLVPFGEYIPFREMWPWIKKVVPLEGDFRPGGEATMIPLSLDGKTLKVGSLICYEDLFPGLARTMAEEGAGMLFVATNSAWYGRSASSAQHMAHSVLRAVETRRIVLRVGNDGWTGWIDEYGNVQDSFDLWEIGGTAWSLDRDTRWIGKQTPYVRNGDWFVWLCYLLLALISFVAWRLDRNQVGY